MKYTCTTEINLPIARVVELWEDENNFKEWQDGFVSIEHLSGRPNSKGAKSRITILGKQKMELLETIISSDLPKEKIGLYEHIHMTNTKKTSFEVLAENKTKYISEVEYSKFNGLMIKMMTKLFPSMFKKQSQKWMKQFKEFAEKKG